MAAWRGGGMAADLQTFHWVHVMRVERQDPRGVQEDLLLGGRHPL